MPIFTLPLAAAVPEIRPEQYAGVMLALLVAIILTLLLTPVTMRLAAAAGVMDQPQARRVHTKPTPRWGGLAMSAAFLLTVALAVMVRPGLWRVERPREMLIGLAVGGVLITALGALDDKYGIPAKWKLLGQILAASVLPLCDVRLVVAFGVDLHPALGAVLTVLWVVAVTNTINLIDGLDGLAAGISGLAALTFVAISLLLRGAPFEAMLAATLAGACLGFLRYNFHPARVFMGDAGSHFPGFAIGALSIWQNWKVATGVALAVPVLILAVPIFDTTFAIIRRLRRGRPIFSPDKGHLHHRLLSLGMNQRQVVGTIYLLTSVGCALALLLARGR